jgi:hypothetical protein
MALKIDSTQERWLVERGVPKVLVQKWRKGVCFPGTQYIVDVAHVMGMSLEELITFINKEQRSKNQSKAS